MKIPLYRVNIPPLVGEEIEGVILSGQISNGPIVQEFEDQLGLYLGNPYTLVTGDVSSTMTLALKLAGVGPGDEVIMSPMVCLATSCPVLNQFAKVRWCDVDPDTGNLDPAHLSRLINDKTKAILVYHWAGYPADMDRILGVAAKHGIPVIEDVGEGLGASYKGRRLGAVGADYSVFSFYPNRHITTIEGGAITFKDGHKWEQARWLRRYGIHQPSFRLTNGEINPDSDIPQPGLNTYMNQVSALLGLKQLTRLPDLLELYQGNAAYYDSQFSEMSGLNLLHYPLGSKPAYWVYTIRTKRRKDLMSFLCEQGIQTSAVHLRNDKYTCFGGPQGALPGTDEFSETTLSLPCGWWVGAKETEFIVRLIKDFSNITPNNPN